MIISHAKKFIFVAVPKAASMTLHEHLYRQVEDECSHDDMELMRTFDGHLTFRELQALTGQTFDDYVKFAVVRNPFDRFISYTANQVGWANDSQLAIDAALENAYKFRDRLLWPQKVFIDGANRILRFETLSTDFLTLAREIGISETNLPLLNTSLHSGYRDLINDSTRFQLENLYADDLRDLGYSF